MKRKNAIILVNGITMTRVIGALILPFLSKKISAQQLILYIVFLLLTDTPDGYLARKYNACTLFGALIDAVADKLLTLATLLVIIDRYPLLWLCVLFEVIITVINYISGTSGSNLKSSMLGKVKTWLLGIGIVIGYLVYFSSEFKNLFSDGKIGLFFKNILTYFNSNEEIIMKIVAISMAVLSLVVAINYIIVHSKELKEMKAKGFNHKKYK